MRNKIEHKMAGELDDALSARFQACCLNYNKYITEIFGDKYAIDKYLSFSLQFSKLNKEQRELIEKLAVTMNEQPPVKKRGLFG